MSTISSNKRDVSASIAALLKGSRSSSPRPSDPNLFLSQLEGRLDNLQKGRVAGSDFVVDAQIVDRNNRVNDALASQDPGLLKNYNSLLTGLTYSKSARVVTEVEYSLRTLSTIPTEKEAKAATDKVVAAYRENAAKQKASEARALAASDRRV